jgi:hypothetical protein
MGCNQTVSEAGGAAHMGRQPRSCSADSTAHHTETDTTAAFSAISDGSVLAVNKRESKEGVMSSFTLSSRHVAAVAGSVICHVTAVVAGLVLMVLGLGLGVTMIMLPVGIVIGMLGFLLVVGGFFAHIGENSSAS